MFEKLAEVLKKVEEMDLLGPYALGGAIALLVKTARDKDRARFKDAAQIPGMDRILLKDVLDRYHLSDRWTEWGGSTL